MKKTYRNRLPKDMEVVGTGVSIENGKLIVEVEMKEKFEPKDGDFCVDADGDVFIVCTERSDISFIGAYIGENKDLPRPFYFNGVTYTKDCRYATPEEKAKFLKRLEKEYHKKWNAEKKCLEDVYIPKFGDVVKVIDKGRKETRRNYMIVIWPEYGDINEQKNGFFNIANISYGGFLSFSCGNFPKGESLEIVPASESEKQELFNELAKDCKRWNPETKQLEDIRWRAEKDEIFYYLDNEGNNVLTGVEDGGIFASMRYESNNYFRTEESAQKVADQLKEIFKKSKAE